MIKLNKLVNQIKYKDDLNLLYDLYYNRGFKESVYLHGYVIYKNRIYFYQHEYGKIFRIKYRLHSTNISEKSKFISLLDLLIGKKYDINKQEISNIKLIKEIFKYWLK